jgi:hypothetical protein
MVTAYRSPIGFSPVIGYPPLSEALKHLQRRRLMKVVYDRKNNQLSNHPSELPDDHDARCANPECNRRVVVENGNFLFQCDCTEEEMVQAIIEAFNEVLADQD